MDLLETLKSFATWFAVIYATVVGIVALFSLTPFGRDDTDEQGWFGRRSGVSLITDERTGCQYLSTHKGGVTPRLGSRGEHVGCGRNE